MTDGYVINLERRPDRLRAFQEDIAQTGLEIEPLEAVDGRALDLSAYDEQVSSWYRVFGNPASLGGTVGCKLSHEAAWEAVAGRDDGLYYVFEDDARLAVGGRWQTQRLTRLVDRAPDDADLIWLNDFDALSPLRVLNRIRGRLDRLPGAGNLGSSIHSAAVRARLTAALPSFRRWPPIVYTTAEAYLLRPQYAEQMLEYTRQWFEAVDGQMKSAVENIGGVAYFARPAVFTQADRSDTDIQL